MNVTKLLPFMAIVVVLGFTSCSTDSAVENTIDATELLQAPQAKQIEIEIMELINNHRINQGLNPLEDHNTDKAVAYTHTDYMIEVTNVSHDNFFQRKQSLQANADANIVSENLAYGFSSA